MSVTLEDVHRALASVADADGVIVVHETSPGKFRCLASRPPLQGGCAQLIILEADSEFRYPDRAGVQADARNRRGDADPPSQVIEAGREADAPAGRGDSPASPATGPERPEDLTLLADDRD